MATLPMSQHNKGLQPHSASKVRPSLKAWPATVAHPNTGTGVLFYITLPPVTDGRHARVDLLIQLDGQVFNYQEDAPSGQTASGKIPFNRQDLDPSRMHDLVITNRGTPGFGDPAPFRLDGIEWRVPAASADVIPYVRTRIELPDYVN